MTLNGSAGPLVLSASLLRKRLGLRSTWFTATPGAPAPKTADIVLHSRVVRNRVLLTGSAPPGAATLQAGGARSGVTSPRTRWPMTGPSRSGAR